MFFKGDHFKLRLIRSLGISIALFFFDIVGMYCSFYLAAFTRRLLIPWIGGQVSWPVYAPMVYLSISLTVILFLVNNLYPGYGLTAVEELKRLVKSLTISYGFLGVSVYVLEAYTYFPRSIFLIAWTLSIFFISLARFALRNRLSLLSGYGIPVIYFARSDHALAGLQSVIVCRRMGWKPMGVFFLNRPIQADAIGGVPVLKTWEHVECIKKKYTVDTILFSSLVLFSGKSGNRWLLQRMTEQYRRVVLVYPADYVGTAWVEPRDLEGQLGLELRSYLFSSWNVVIKRVFDLVISLLLLLITFPLWLLIALMIRLDSPGPIFYKHQRVGQGGKKFRVIKFRTMYSDADEHLRHYLENNPRARQEWQEHQKLENDPRITPLGAWLRKFSLDELPQLLNVLRGDLSLIGPRAVTEEEIEKYGRDAELILRVKPGITGWWQVMGRHQTGWERRTKLDLYYVSNWSLWMDFYITLKTIWVVISGQGI
jgi:Undecaprenyl-phosphate galactose phosphotransferase WbaP